ncbi:MAG: NAD-binding protein [Candidatus Thalassarchaeaceae archaeon]|nr:NAD-binding protein [Candidatus Thalassarchaeaceae archaeon]
MRVIIGGAGEVGRGVANALRQEKRSVALIDPKPSAINESQSIDSLLVTGSVLSRDSLLRAGISDAEIIVMATNNDEINLLACAFAKRVYSEQVGDRNAAGLTAIAVISNPNLMNTDRGAGPLERWSRADHIVCSSDEIVEQLAAGLLAPSIDEILAFGDKSWISAVEVTSKSALIGVKTGEVSNIFVDIPSIYAISTGEEGGRLTDGSEIIKEGDILVFVSRSTSQFSQITKAVGRVDPELPEKPQVAIFGATQFGNKLAKHYLKFGSEVVVIEPNLDYANELVGSKIGMNKRLDVIHGDPQDEDLLRELGIDQQDITIAALNDDNLNIAISMRAKDKGVARTGLLLKDRALVEAVQRIGLTRPISRRLVTVTSILKSIHMNIPGTYQSIPTLPEIISMSATLSVENNLVGRTIPDAENKIGSRIVMIEKEDEDGVLKVLTPNQVETLEMSDKIYLFLEKTDLKRVEKSLEN